MRLVQQQIAGTPVHDAPLLALIADWPFAGYITTNYDTLVEDELRRAQRHGWLTVGNEVGEVQRVTGDATQLAWHVHGFIPEQSATSKLILTDEDYDLLYTDTSPVIQQLKALLANRRVVFIGFGFQDVEVLRLIRLAGQLCSPARPAFAFLSGSTSDDRADLLERFNVDVIPYRNDDGNHGELIELLRFYGSFVLRRSLRFGVPRRDCPSYDPETTGLLTYNELVLSRRTTFHPDVVDLLASARFLSLLKYRGASDTEDLVSDLSERARLMAAEPRGGNTEVVTKALASLAGRGLVTTDPDGRVSLSAEGEALVANHSARAQTAGLQFTSSLFDRAEVCLDGDKEAARRVAACAEAFLKDCVARRALGVALSWRSSGSDVRDFHILALLQSLPVFLEQLTDAREAIALVRVVQGLLARPTEIEAQYLGAILQAHFAVNILGFGPDAIAAKMRDVAGTLFLIDSSTLIPLLGRSSTGHGPAMRLLLKLRQIGAAVGTTELLASEVAEHARFALRYLDAKGGAITPKALEVASGRAGHRTNVFVEGFVTEVARGEIPPDMGRYLESVCANVAARRGADDAFVDAISKLGIDVRSMARWEGFSNVLYAERDRLQNEIADYRAKRSTFRHERQVKAEAEVLIIVEKVRDKTFTLAGEARTDAYFVSQTGAIDRVAGSERPITMRADAALEWLNTLSGATKEELADLTDNLLWELSERGLSVVDTARLAVVFGPLISASRDRLTEELERQRPTIADMYGVAQADAFAQVRDIDAPVALLGYETQRADRLASDLEKARAATAAAQAKRTLTDKEREELARLRAEKKGREQRARSRKRAAASKKRGRRSRRRRKGE